MQNPITYYGIGNVYTKNGNKNPYPICYLGQLPASRMFPKQSNKNTCVNKGDYMVGIYDSIAIYTNPNI